MGTLCYYGGALWTLLTYWGPAQNSLIGSDYFLISKHRSPPIRLRVLKPVGGNGTKQHCDVHQVIYFFPQSKTLASRCTGWQMGSRGCGMGVDDIIWATCLCWFGLDLSGHYFLITECKKGKDDPRKWRKIGGDSEDLWGIPTCRAEIGKWAVVITGCRIDVVPINQNCWINKKLFKASVPWRCQKYVRSML